MKTINQDIAEGTFKPVYLLFGTEAYLIKQYKDKLVKALLPEGDTMNLTRYEGDKFSPGEVIDQAETMPFFADRRVIVMEDSGLFGSAESELAEYMKEIPESTVFVFAESKVDKRSKMYKNTMKAGYAAELNLPGEEDLVKWIAGKMRKEKKQASRNTVLYFISKCGSDMNTMESELEKLFSYTMHTDQITTADIDAICTAQVADRIFDMITAYSNGQYDRALGLYYDLLTLKEAPLKILSLLGRQFRILYTIADTAGRGMDPKSIAQIAGVAPFVVTKNTSIARKLGKERLKETMEFCAGLEEAVKTGNLNDQLSVELLLTRRG